MLVIGNPDICKDFTVLSSPSSHPVLSHSLERGRGRRERERGGGVLKTTKAVAYWYHDKKYLKKKSRNNVVEIYQNFYAELSVPNEMHILHFHVPMLSQMQLKILLRVWKCHPLIELPKHNSHSQLHSAVLHCNETNGNQWSKGPQ